ncbi:hypothetical protein ACQ4PT_053660 [Festuca glaucescens]
MESMWDMLPAEFYRNNYSSLHRNPQLPNPNSLAPMYPFLSMQEDRVIYFALGGLNMTKSSSDRKARSSATRHSKLSLMRKKLTLKNTLPSVYYAKYSEDNGGGGCATDESKEEEEAVVFSQVKAKKAFQRASRMKLVSLYPYITPNQRTLIRDAKYGGMLEIKCSKLQPELCKFLMQSFDPSSCEMVFPGRGSIPVNEVSVEEVLGVPRGKIEVRYERDSEATKFMKEQLGNGVRKQPTIASLKNKLLSMKKANTKYLRLFITYAMCSVLAPTTGVKYLDSLQLEDIDVSEEGTRVAAWTNAMVRKAIMQDTWSDGRFGKAPLKPEFRTTTAQSGSKLQGDEETSVNANEEECSYGLNENTEGGSERSEGRGNDAGDVASILFPDDTNIDGFIDLNAPANRTPQCPTAPSSMEQSDPVQCDATEEHGNTEKLQTNDQPEPVEAFLAELKGKQQIELQGQCVPGTSKDTKQMGFMEAQLAQSFSYDEEKIEHMRREDLLRMVRGSPCKELDIPLLDLPVISMEIEESRNNVATSVLKDLPLMNPDDAKQGLISLIDGSLRPEAAKLLSDMEPKSVTMTRKKVTFADQKKPATPSPGRYRTRAAAREEASSSPNKSTRATKITTNVPGKKASPRKGASQQGSPNDSARRRVTRATSSEFVDLTGNDDATTSNVTTYPHNDAAMNRKLDFNETVE